MTHSRYETEQYRYSLYMPVTVPSDGFLFSIKELQIQKRMDAYDLTSPDNPCSEGDPANVNK